MRTHTGTSDPNPHKLRSLCLNPQTTLIPDFEIPILLGECMTPAWKVVCDAVHEFPNVRVWVHSCGSRLNGGRHGGSPMKPVQLGVIGCGVISGSHLTAAAGCPLAEVVAVADLIPERVQAAGDKFGIEARYPGDEELLGDDRVEAVVLAMPVADRTPVAFKALEKGKHVLIEKPIAAKAADVEKMIALRGDRVAACCSSRMSFTGHAEAATKCVASGSLGKIRLIRIRALHGASADPHPAPPPWRQSMARNGGGILVNWSCYDLDYVLQIIGWQVEPRSVFAQWWPVADGMAEYVAPGSDADSHYTALIACADDIVISMERAEFSTTTSDEAWEIIGTEGSLHLPMQSRKAKPGAVVLNRFVPGEGVASETIWEQGEDEANGGVLEEFVGAIRGGPPPRTDLEKALLMQKITNAIYASGESCQSVPIS